MAADRRQGGIDRRCKRQQHQAERDADGVETRFWVQFLLFLTVPLVGCGAQAPRDLLVPYCSIGGVRGAGPERSSSDAPPDGAVEKRFVKGIRPAPPSRGYFQNSYEKSALTDRSL